MKIIKKHVVSFTVHEVKDIILKHLEDSGLKPKDGHVKYNMKYTEDGEYFNGVEIEVEPT